MSRILIEVEGAGTIEVVPNESGAPELVAALSAFFATERESRAIHVMYDGPAMMMVFPPDESVGAAIRGAAAESLTCYPQPGDLVWFRFPAGTFPGQRAEIWELALAYAPGVRLFNQLGWTPASIVGSATKESLDALAELGPSLRIDGAKAVRVRWEPGTVEAAAGR